MDERDIAAIVVTTEPEVRYFTGFHTPFWQSPTRPWFTVIPATGKPVAIIPSIGRASMAETWIDDIRTWSSPRPDDDGVTLLVGCLRELSAGGRIGMPMGPETHVRMPLCDLDRVRAEVGGFTDVTDIVSGLRMVKEQRLPAAAALLPREFDFDVIGYGCTSAATLIGTDRVTAAIQSEHPGVSCTDPIMATVAALRALHAHRVAVVTPYTADVTAPIARSFADEGLSVTALGSFLESNDLTVARISPQSIADGVRTMTRRADCDAVFVSCTSLRLLASVTDLESEVGMPVLSSNTALFWHLLRLAGIADEIDGSGRLFTRQLAAG